MITPATSIQIPLRIAQATRAVMLPTIIALQTVAAFWAAWHAVYRGAK
jgi:hypothetical protein